MRVRLARFARARRAFVLRRALLEAVAQGVHVRVLKIVINHNNAGFFAYVTFALNQLLYAEQQGAAICRISWSRLNESARKRREMAAQVYLRWLRLRAGYFPVVFFGATSGCDAPPLSDEGASCGPNAYYDETAGPNMWEYYFEQPGGLSLEEITR